MPSVGGSTTPLLTCCQGSGKPPWKSLQSSTLPSPLECWVSFSVSTCPLGYAMLLPHSNAWWLSGRAELFDLPGVLRWCCHLLEYPGEAHRMVTSCTWAFQVAWVETNPQNVSSSKRALNAGVWPSRENLKAIAKYPEPMTYTAMKGFIGVVGHYRHFIKDFAKIADLLYKYSHGDTAKKKEQVMLNEATRKAFHQLKKLSWVAPYWPILTPIKNTCLRQMLQN